MRTKVTKEECNSCDSDHFDKHLRNMENIGCTPGARNITQAKIFTDVRS